MTTDAERKDPAHRLATLLLEARVQIAVEDRQQPPTSLHGLGQHDGYLRLARLLIAAGVRTKEDRP